MENNNFNQAEEAQQCIVCQKEISDLSEATLIPGVGFTCSKECSLAREIGEAKDEAFKTIKEEVLPALQIATEVMASDEGQQVIAEAQPIIAVFLEQYGNIIGTVVSGLGAPVGKMKAAAIKQLQEEGFTRSEAIQLMCN